MGMVDTIYAAQHIKKYRPRTKIYLGGATVDQAAKLFGAKSMVCNWFMGIFSANGEISLGVKNLKLEGKKRICDGAPFCVWESKW